MADPLPFGTKTRGCFMSSGTGLAHDERTGCRHYDMSACSGRCPRCDCAQCRVAWAEAAEILAREFWERVSKSAAEVAKWPEWMRAAGEAALFPRVGEFAAERKEAPKMSDEKLVADDLPPIRRYRLVDECVRDVWINLIPCRMTGKRRIEWRAELVDRSGSRDYGHELLDPDQLLDEVCNSIVDWKHRPELVAEGEPTRAALKSEIAELSRRCKAYESMESKAPRLRTRAEEMFAEMLLQEREELVQLRKVAALAEAYLASEEYVDGDAALRDELYAAIAALPEEIP